MKLAGNHYKDAGKGVVMRVFVAVEIQDGDVLGSIRDVQNELGIRARPVATQNMHFTLQFLGEVSEDRIPGITSALRTVRFSPFGLEIRCIGAFPRPEMPRIVWIGTDREGGENMARLARSVENVLKPLGFSRDRAFRPHLTIFRIKSRIGDITKDLDRFEGTKFGRVVISEIRLKQSRLAPSGPTYSDLEVVRAE